MPSSIRRQVKNVVNNYSEAEKKVREATSNDPWGPPSSLMSQIADLTYNMAAFSEIMRMVWRRLGDRGRNWRHVYKALTLLEYLVKTGSERVALQCRENILGLQALAEFRYVDRDGRDRGVGVREKSRQLGALLKDGERLRAERSHALRTKERMAQVATAMGGDSRVRLDRESSQPSLPAGSSEQRGRSGGSPASYPGSLPQRVSSELEQARPQTIGEEELQLQLALAMSREVAEQEERKRRGEKLWLQVAQEDSSRGCATGAEPVETAHAPLSEITLLDVMDTATEGAADRVSDPWAAALPPANPWQASASESADPWGVTRAHSTPRQSADPWGASAGSAPSAGVAADPWGAECGTHPQAHVNRDGNCSMPSWACLDLMDVQQGVSGPDGKADTSRTASESFLSSTSSVVNPDPFVSKPARLTPVSNPFLVADAAQVNNPFQVSGGRLPPPNQRKPTPLVTCHIDPPPFPCSTAPPAGPTSMVPFPGVPEFASVGLVTPVVGVGRMAAIPAAHSLLSPGLLPSTGCTTDPFLLGAE
ncbi:epsin-2-like [Brienomyrus brachyistius]|uniref:epsin-2-like n=1 Tax=Brienomyrus brachyistius TaxID=42636 RepID=UPI0020B220F2|nr:epsin-2-like [Brienomyrus brachyistius]XP_048871452.1 epsin-2-like [Brienomyrus brachyistius]